MKEVLSFRLACQRKTCFHIDIEAATERPMSSLAHIPADHAIAFCAMIGGSLGIGVWAIGHQFFSREA